MSNVSPGEFGISSALLNWPQAHLYTYPYYYVFMCKNTGLNKCDQEYLYVFREESESTLSEKGVKLS